MNFFLEFILAFRSYFSAFQFVRKHSLWYLLLVPAVFNLLASFFVLYISWLYAGDITDYMLVLLGIEGESSWTELLQFVISFLIRAIVALLYIKLFRYILLIFFAPILAFIAEKVQEITTNSTKPFNIVQFTKDIYRGMAIAFRNLFLELIITAIILLASAVLPILTLVAPFLIFVIESYFYGFAMIDYRNECKLLSAKESRQLIAAHRGLAIGNGVMFNVFLLIPFLGVMFAPVLAVIAGSLAMNKIDN